MSLFATPPYEKEEPKLCAECGGILDDDYFCTDCGAESNYGSDADDFYNEYLEENRYS